MNNEIARIIALSGIEPADYPSAVTTALAFQAETTALLERVKATPPVDLASAVTVKDVAKVHAAAVAYDREHEIAARHADKLVTIAAVRVDDAWRQSMSALAVTIGRSFDGAAKALLAELAALDPTADPATLALEHWNPDRAALREALATLNALHQVRDLMAQIGGIRPIYSNEYEHDSRTLWFESGHAHARFRQRLHGVSADDYYLVATTTPGVRIGWQTQPQQNEQPAPAIVTKRDAALAAAIAQRSSR